MMLGNQHLPVPVLRGWPVPSRPQYVFTSSQWRDAISTRLGVPLSFLQHGPAACCCHNAFDRRTGDINAGVSGAQRGKRRRRRRKRPKPVDAHGEHDQRCPHAFSLGRHDDVQNSALMRKLREAGKPTKPATVHELRASSSDRSLRKGDLTVDELATDGRQTLLDVGIAHPLVDTYLNNNKSTVDRHWHVERYHQGLRPYNTPKGDGRRQPLERPGPNQLEHDPNTKDKYTVYKQRRIRLMGERLGN